MAIDEKAAAKIQSYLDVLRKDVAGIEAKIVLIEAVLYEQPTVGQQAKRLLDYFVTQWELKYAPAKYVVNGAKDMATLKGLLKTLTAREIAERMLLYLRSADEFRRVARHPIGLFAANINSLGAPARPRSLGPRYEEPWYAECAELHESVCTGEQMHKNKMVAAGRR